MADDWREGGFGLYLHWPFCQAKCPYCDFNSHVVAAIDEERWARAYIREIERLGAETEGRVLNSVFLGGGTPSMMSAELVDRVLTAVRATWPIANDIEITLEANPTSTEADRFAGYRMAGVNRVSLGVQALNDPDLRRLGRMHSVSEALTAIEIARTTFGRMSFDLIYGRQDQSLSDWSEELTQALALSADHLSVYQLTVEDGTVFAARQARGQLRGLPSEDLGADLYELTQAMTDAAELAAYEISNHAKVGSESRHNRIYWQSGDYIGIGPGAQGRLTLDGIRFATDTGREPLPWLRQVETTGAGEAPRVPLTAEEHLTEMLLMGLRLAEGIDRARLVRNGFRTDTDAERELIDLGLLSDEPDRLRVTANGRPVLNGVLRRLLEGQDPAR